MVDVIYWQYVWISWCVRLKSIHIIVKIAYCPYMLLALQVCLLGEEG